MDSRIQATQQKLVMALRSLMQRYPWESITIASICQESEISRSTFYTHHKDKEELMQLSLDVLAEELAPTDTRRGLNTTCTLKFLPALLEHIKNHRDILEKNRNSAAAGYIQKNLQKTIAGLVNNEIKVSLYANTVEQGKLVFICGGIFSIIEHWTDGECHESTTNTLATIDREIRNALQSR